VIQKKVQGFSSGSLFHATHADASGANANLFARAIDPGANALEVRIPAAAARVVGVADHVAEMRRFAANFTLQCHDSFLHSEGVIRKVLIVAEAGGNTKFAAFCKAGKAARNFSRFEGVEGSGDWDGKPRF
jgi:hypothetical protein